MDRIGNIFLNLRGDKIIWFIVTMLAICSILAVYSAAVKLAYANHGGNTEFYLVQQIMFITLGIICMVTAYRFNYMLYSRLAVLGLVITIVLLAYTLMFGIEIHDAKRWINIPGLNKTIQTSDIAKLALIVYVARALSLKQNVIKDFKSAFLPIIIPVVVVCSLIAPADLSTSLLLFGTCLLMMIIGRVSLKYVFLMFLVGLAALAILVLLGTVFPEFIRLETWISRVTEFFSNTDGGWQIQQSKIAIANGGWFGQGPGGSIQRDYLPYASADFIYAIICEEYGILGGFTLIALYLGLLFRCTSMVTRCHKTFGAILAIGLCLNIVVQAMANIAVSVHLVPVTGLTLPMVSMGGTSIIFTCISLGIILSVSRYVEEYSTYEIMQEEAEVRNEEVTVKVNDKRMKYENYY